MSTVIVLKERDELLIATDSRFMKHDFSGIASDTAQKLFEIGPETFIAPTGWKMACDFDVAKTRELVSNLRTTDIRVLAEALVKESVPQLEELVTMLRSIQHLHDKIRIALEGQLTLHATVLAGRTASGELGYISHVFRFQGGGVVYETKEYFGTEGQIYTTSGDPAWQVVGEDPTILTGGKLEVVRKLLAAFKRVWPTIGGDDQIVRIDGSGARWIGRRPAEAATYADHGLETATALFGGTATFASSSSGPYVQVGSAGAVFADNFASPTATVTVASTGITIAKGSSSVQVTSSGISISNGSSSVTVTSGSVAIANGSFSCTGGSLTVNIDSANYVKVSSSGGQSQVLDTTIRTQNSSNTRFIQLSSGGQITGQSIGGSTFSVDGNNGLIVQGNQVAGPRQAGPGNPIFTTISDVQTWCQNLINGIRSFGALT